MNTPHQAPQEGVIKFTLDHQTAPLPQNSQIAALSAWFAHCRKRGLIGQDPKRYQGAAYGNISQRAAQGFLITGTQTGGQTQLTAADICWVRHIDLEHNRLISSGPALPSSESMTHEQVYRHLAWANFVIHVHHAPLWQAAARLGLPITDPQAEYGTPEMALEVERLLRNGEAQNATQAHVGAFSMGGHEDGIVVFGDSPEAAGRHLLELYGRSL